MQSTKYNTPPNTSNQFFYILKLALIKINHQSPENPFLKRFTKETEFEMK